MDLGVVINVMGVVKFSPTAFKNSKIEVLNEHVQRKLMYHKFLLNHQGYGILTRFDHLHGHDGLKNIRYYLKNNFLWQIFTRFHIKINSVFSSLIFVASGLCQSLKYSIFLLLFLLFGQKSF